MEKEIKHRLKRSRRRERAERMQAQRDHGDSAEDETLSGVKPHRPPIRRKKAKEPIFEEDIIDGFAILAFRSYEELEMAVKMATTKNSKYNSLGEDKMRNQANLRVINRHSPAPGHDAGTSDDSGRASEVRPPGLPHGQRESSHDRLSDASSRCSSERGYICDSEGEDDKGSDAGSLFAATPVSTPRKHETADSGGAQGALLTNGVASPPRTGVLSNVSPPGTVPLQPNGLAENARNSMGATLPNFQSPHFDKTLEGERTTKPRMDNLALNSNEKTRAEINCQTLDKRLETNTHVENKRTDGNTHQQMVSNFDKRLDGHLNHLEKGRMEGMHHDKNLLEKSRLDSVHLEKSRVDGLPVHVLENAPVPSHLDKRTLDIASGQVNKCLENSVHAPLSLDKRKDSLATGIMDKGRMERDVSMAHAPVSSPTHGSAIPNPGAPGSHVHSPALPNNPPHPQAVHPGGNTIPHKPMHQNQMYQNSMRTHLHNSGLSSQSVPPMQFPPKKPLFLHNLNLSPSSRPLNAPTTSSVPLTTTSVSPVISTSNLTSSSSSVSNSGIYNLSTTLSLSNNGAVSHNPMGIHHHSTHNSVNHMSNQSRSLNEPIPPRPINSPQPGGVLRTASDLNQTVARTNTPSSGQPPGLGSNHSTSHTISQVHGRVTPSVISSASSTPTTSTTLSAVVSLSSHAELPVTSTVSGHSGLSLHSSMPSGGNLLNHVGAQGSGSPGIHSGYSLPLSNSSYSGYPPLYGPYGSNLQHNPYLPPRIEPPASIGASSLSKQQSLVSGTIASSVCATSVVTTSTTTSHRDIITTPAVGRTHSPRGHSPTRERDSYSSNVSSLSRGSTTPVNGAPSASPFSSAPSSSLPNASSYVKNPVWVSAPGPGPAKPSLHPSNFPPPMFAPPLPPPAAPPGPAPFSAESLFQTNQADLLRRELDNRFLASQERTLGVPAFLRTEMHHHQHQHTHVHQHQAAALYPPPLFKEIPKLGGVDSPFYRGNLGLASYPGFSPGLLGPGLPSTPFAPPSHLPTFTPKQVGDVSKPRIAKTGKWNAMHVRVAWEIYHHQQKQAAESKSTTLGGSGSKDTLLRPSGHLFPPAGPPHEFARYPAGFLPPPPHIGSTVSPFGRYPPMGSFGPPPASTFSGISGFPSRDISSLGPLPTVHDPWRLRAPSAFPVGPSPWSLKPDPSAIDRRETEEREREREREREKERIRREREERERDRERREREEKRKLEMERERREKERRELERRELERFNKVRERSPIRNGEIKEESRPAKEDDIVILGRSGPGGPYPPHSYGIGRHPGLRPPPLTPHFTPSGWPPPGADPYAYRLDPLLRYNPLVPYRQEEEEQRGKLYGVGGFLPPHAPHHPSSSPVLLKKEESQSR